jgi:CrcB protein
VRYAADLAAAQRLGAEFPYGTLVINVVASLVLGLALGLGVHHGMSASAVAVIGSGFAGGASTLSTWAWESLAFARSGERLAAAVNVVASVALGVGAAAAGFGIALL